jgi:hypothetical protein
VGLVCAETGTCGPVTGGGVNTNATNADWDLSGALDYTATGTSGGTILYAWTQARINAAPAANYIDAPIPHRAVIVKTPGTIIWESCAQNNLDTFVYDPQMGSGNEQIFTPNPDSSENSSMAELVFKIQTKNRAGTLLPAQFTLKKDAS